ncbi:MAG: hypothetical protein PVF93_02100 [Chromatiaceae bacterium]|jgi:hypothetical protein
MNEAGVWKVEMLGPYGWETMSTAFLENGTYRAGSTAHYSLGTYTLKDDLLIVHASVVMHKGVKRTLFGQEGDRHQVQFEGTIDGDMANGVASDENGQFLTRFRATKLADL